MDDGLKEKGGDPPSPSSEKKTYAEIIKEAFPFYLHIGMTYEQYFYGNPYLAVYYREAYKLKNDQMNEMMWWNGYYTYIAFATALSNMHFDGKKHKINEYMKEPLRIRPLTEEEQEAENEKVRNKVVAQLNMLKANWDVKHSEEQNVR